MPYEQYKADYDRDGFVIIRQFLSPDELADLSRKLDTYIRDVVPTLPDGDAFYEDKARPDTLKQMNHLRTEPALNDYARHPKFNALAVALAGEEVRVEDPQWFNKPPGTNHPTPAHQDNYYLNLHPCIVATMWLALDVVDDENGCLRYVRGSHLDGYRPHGRSNVLGFSQGITDFGPDDIDREVPIHLRPGDVAVHHGMTIHRADPNRSSARHRRSFAILYKGVSCRRDETAYARYQAALKSQHAELGLKAT